MSEKYGEDQPWHLTQEPDVAPSYEELEERIEELKKELSEANKRGDAWRFRADIAEAKLAKAVEGLLLARVHVANNEQGWSVGRASARSDLKIINALLAEIEGSDAP
jgi:DNA replication initiation complex subunit (GINS family)